MARAFTNRNFSVGDLSVLAHELRPPVAENKGEWHVRTDMKVEDAEGWE